MVIKREYLRHGLLLFLFLVIASNMMLYHTSFGENIIAAGSNAVVIGSIIDFAIISPILYLSWARKWNWKYIVITMAAGLILVRLLVPMHYLEPYEPITWAGFLVEGFIVLLELVIIFTLVRYLPRIVGDVKQSSLPLLFSFHHAVAERVKHSPVIQVVCAEMLMFYYALACWKKQPRLNDSTFTLHRNTSLIAFQVMLIHAIIIETIGIHWWFHEMSPGISFVLLLLNIYSVLLIIGDIQAIRLNPLYVTDEKMYVSLGIKKRIEIEWSNVEQVIDDPEELKEKLSKDTIQFIAKDMEEVPPTVLLRLKEPADGTLIMGIKKKYNQVAIRVDDPQRFIAAIDEKLAKWQ